MFDFVSTVAGCAPTAGEVYKVLHNYTTERDYAPVVKEEKEEAINIVKVERCLVTLLWA